MGCKSAKRTDSRRILLVDGDRAGLAALSESLVAAGYEVTAASSGEDALRSARAGSYGLAVIDLRTPDMSGTQLAARLAAELGCFSLILSGQADPESIRSAVGAGALGYLMKPIAADELIPAIETGLARSREMSRLLHSHENLSVALREGRATSMAIGMLMERMRISREAAFERLRGSARSQRRRVEEVAEALLQAAEAVNGALH